MSTQRREDYSKRASGRMGGAGFPASPWERPLVFAENLSFDACVRKNYVHSTFRIATRLMSRSLSDPLAERLLRSFPPDRAYTRTDWADDAMPDPVAHFLNQLLDHHSRREARRLRRARTNWVDYDDPEMEGAVRTFFRAVEGHTQVPADEWEDTVHQAARHTTAHLVRPARVLGTFVFGNRDKPLRLPEVLWRMDFFGPYAYLRKAVHAFAQKRDLDAFSPDRFEQFLYRVDERVTADFDADRWLRVLDPLFQVARRAVGRERVPVLLLQTFFAEKSATGIEQRLARYEADGHDEAGPKVLYRLIEEAASQDSPPAPESSSSRDLDAPPTPDGVTDTPPEAEASSDDDIWGVAGAARPEEGNEPQPASDGEGDAPLWQQFQRGRTRNEASDDETAEQQPLWAQYRRGRDQRVSDAVSTDGGASLAEESETEDSPDAPISGTAASEKSALEALERDILGTANPPHRSVYVRQLFNGDRTAYREVLDRLRDAESWGEASQIIASDIFRTYKVNIYSDAAVHFTNAVESRFRGA